MTEICTEKIGNKRHVNAWAMRTRFAGTLACLLVCATGQAATLAVNPYADIAWEMVEQYKFNLHTHTTESDGRMTPGQVIDEYHQRGYHGLAITDHNLNTWPWTDYGRGPLELGMLAIPGNELSRHHHTLSLFTTYTTEETDHGAALQGLAEAGGMGVLCHPAMHWLREYHTAPSLSVPLAPRLRSLTLGEFAVEAWFRTSDAGRNILLGNFSPNYAGALNLELHTENRVRLYVHPGGAGRTVDLNVNADALGIDTRDGRWHHLAGVRENGEMRLYLDGQLAGKKPDLAGPFELQGEAFHIGRDTRTGDTAFQGELAAVRLWERALAKEEVEALAAQGLPETHGLLAEYRFAGDVAAETAAHPDGPFPAEALGTLAAKPIIDAPAALRAQLRTPHALAFGPGEFPQTVPDAAVEQFKGLFIQHPHLAAIEVHNRTRPEREYPLDRELWDRLLADLMPDRPVWGMAVDDMHSMQHLGGDWVVALAESLTLETARGALETGRYYFASTRLHEPDDANAAETPRIISIRHDREEGTISVSAATDAGPVPDERYKWIANGQQVHIGPSLAYKDLAKTCTYARLEITGPGGTTYTNPFGFTAGNQAYPSVTIR